MEIIRRENFNENFDELLKTPPSTENADTIVEPAKVRDGIAGKETNLGKDEEITRT